MRRWKRLLMIGLVVTVLLFVAAVVAALAFEPAAPAATDLSWQVVASGGATMSSPSFTMLSTAAQPVAGPASGSNFTLLSGYWQSFQEAVRSILLPFIIGSP